jgi:putative resolvase
MYIIYGMKVSIGQAAKELGVSRETLRRWEAAGKIQVERTPKGHRRYDLSKLYGITPHPALAGRPTLAYACVSSHDQKEDLNRQVAWLETYCAANGWTDEVIQDWGSGMNNPKKGLQQLIQRIGSGQVGR